MKCTARMEDETEIEFCVGSIESFYVPTRIDIDKIKEIGVETLGKGPRCFYSIDPKTRRLSKDDEA